MTFTEIRTFHGVRFAQDNYGWIWREVAYAPPRSPRWVRLDVPSFTRLAALTATRRPLN